MKNKRFQIDVLTVEDLDQTWLSPFTCTRTDKPPPSELP